MSEGGRERTCIYQDGPDVAQRLMYHAQLTAESREWLSLLTRNLSLLGQPVHTDRSKRYFVRYELIMR